MRRLPPIAAITTRNNRFRPAGVYTEHTGHSEFRFPSAKNSTIFVDAILQNRRLLRPSRFAASGGGRKADIMVLNRIVKSKVPRQRAGRMLPHERPGAVGHSGRAAPWSSEVRPSKYSLNPYGGYVRMMPGFFTILFPHTGKNLPCRTVVHLADFSFFGLAHEVRSYCRAYHSSHTGRNPTAGNGLCSVGPACSRWNERYC